MPTVLYKYMRTRFAYSLLHHGMLRVGTIYEYRDTERHGAQIGDVHEGVKGSDTRFENKVLHGQDDLPEHLQESGLRTHGNVVFSNTTVRQAEHSQDFYLYCFAKTLSRELMHALGCNACIRIRSVEDYLNAITRSMRHKARFVGFAAVAYAERFAPHPLQPHAAHPALLKGPEYAYQDEVRAIWEPLKPGKNIKPELIRCSSAPRWCERVEP